MEIKSCNVDFTIKNEDQGVVSGYGAFYNNVDSSNDIIKFGAFSDVNRSIKMLKEHRDLIGVWGTVKEDNNGLFVEGRITLDTQLGKETYSLIKSGALTSMSVGFKTLDYSYDKNETRLIEKADLYEVSLVSFPANEKATILSCKSEDIQTEREFERALRELGYSKNDSKMITNYGFKAFMEKKEEKNKDSQFMSEIVDDLKSVLNMLQK